MGEWKSRKDSEGHQEPAGQLAGTSPAEERDVPAEVFLLADLLIILRLGTWKKGGGEDTEGFHCEAEWSCRRRRGGGGSAAWAMRAVRA
jgi:hypothetical protein